MTSKGTTRRSVRIDDELWGRVSAAAEVSGESVSDVIRRALESYSGNAFALNQGETDPRGATCGLHDADGWDHPGAQPCWEADEERRALLAH